MASRDESNRSAQRSDWKYLMIIVLVALAASALLGLATGLVFRVWANVIISPLIAVVSAVALASHGFGFSGGALVTVACLFISQVAYLVGAFLVSRARIANFLAEDVFDDEPDDHREHDIGDDQEERREHPSRSSPPET
jgi:uncharacterized membrane protein